MIMVNLRMIKDEMVMFADVKNEQCCDANVSNKVRTSETRKKL